MHPCTEKKVTLSGNVHLFKCDLVHLRRGFGVLRYVVDGDYNVGGVKLRPGDITHAFYWTDRPYTLYRWQLERIPGTVYYFNIADRIALRPEEFSWRDLAVDILVGAEGSVQVLDEEELPEGLETSVMLYIQAAKSVILNGYPDITHNADLILQRLQASP